MGLSTHILDTALGRPAVGVTLVLSREAGDGWGEVGRGQTDADGRCRTLLGEQALERATYKLRFETAPYFAAQKMTALYPYVEIVFSVADSSQHYHIPLLLAANGYTTYRGS
jgi:5-hydroxyisourate hydrolase